MKRVSLLVFTCICCLFFVCCEKTDTPAGPDQDPTPDPPPPTVVDSITAIAVSILKSTEQARYVSVFNADGSLRWKKKVGINNGLTGSLVYDNGKLFHTYGFGIQAYDINNGALLWDGYRNTTASSPVAKNGILYSASDSWYLLEIDAASGTLARSPSIMVGELMPYPPVIKDSTAYVVSGTQLAYYSVKAVDIKQGTEKWATPIGYNPPGGLSVVDDMLFIVSGTGQLKAININTGALQWAITGKSCAGYITSGNTLYAMLGENGLAAIDIHSGAKRWEREYPSQGSPYQSLYLYNQQLVVQAGGQYPGTIAVNTANGDSLWTKSRPLYFYYSLLSAPVLSGGKVFQCRNDVFEPYDNKIMIFDPATFKPIDSINVDGDSFDDLKIITKSAN